MPENETSAIMLAIGRLEGKIEGFISKQAEQDKRLNNHSERLGSLEKFKAKIIGIAVAAGFVSSVILRFVPQMFKQ